MKNPVFLLLVLAASALFFPACKNKDSAPAAKPDVAITGNAAIDEVTQKIAADPGNASLYGVRAQLFYKNEGYDNAIADLKSALTLDSTNVDYHHLLADIYLDYNSSILAVMTMQRAVALHPERIPTLLKLAEFQLIVQKYQEAGATVDKVLRLDPQNAEGYFMLGRIFEEMSATADRGGEKKLAAEHYARAISGFQKAVDLDADLIDAWIKLGQLWSKKGDSRAARYFDAALRIDSTNVNALHTKAAYLHQNDRLNEALALYRSITTRNPQYFDALFNAGVIYLEMDSLAKAWTQFDICTKIDPLEEKGFFYRGIVAEKQGEFEEAKTDYEQAVALLPTYEKAKNALLELQDRLRKKQNQ